MQRFFNTVKGLTSWIFKGPNASGCQLAIPHDLPHDFLEDPSFPDAKDDGFLFAVPKTRRNLETRRIRRMFMIQQDPKLELKQNLITCLECGHWHERKTICPNCYEKVRDETNILKSQMDEQVTPIDGEVKFVYEGEECTEEEKNLYKVVHVNKQRPSWFPDTLLRKSNK